MPKARHNVAKQEIEPVLQALYRAREAVEEAVFSVELIAKKTGSVRRGKIPSWLQGAKSAKGSAKRPVKAARKSRPHGGGQ